MKNMFSFSLMLACLFPVISGADSNFVIGTRTVGAICFISNHDCLFYTLKNSQQFDKEFTTEFDAIVDKGETRKQLRHRLMGKYKGFELKRDAKVKILKVIGALNENLNDMLRIQILEGPLKMKNYWCSSTAVYFTRDGKVGHDDSYPEGIQATW